ncbi:MAG: transposase [Anaerolineae bacterium]
MLRHRLLAYQPAPPRSRKTWLHRHRRKANRELQSRTDPEATIISRQGFGLHLAYKAHLAVAGKRGQVITAAVATTGATADEHLLGEMLWAHRPLSKLPIPELVADAKYGTATNYLYLHKAGIRAFIPPRRYGHQASGVWGRGRFCWLTEEDAFLCPAGRRLRRFTNVTTTRRIGYRAPKGSCADCRFRAQCAPSGRERTIHRLWEQDLVEAALELTASPLGQQRLAERKVWAEGVFGLAKELHGLRRTRFKGRRKVQIQLWLTAAMNLKRAVQAMRRGTPTLATARAALSAAARWVRRRFG